MDTERKPRCSKCKQPLVSHMHRVEESSYLEHSFCDIFVRNMSGSLLRCLEENTFQLKQLTQLFSLHFDDYSAVRHEAGTDVNARRNCNRGHLDPCRTGQRYGYAGGTTETAGYASTTFVQPEVESPDINTAMGDGLYEQNNSVALQKLFNEDDQESGLSPDNIQPGMQSSDADSLCLRNGTEEHQEVQDSELEMFCRKNMNNIMSPDEVAGKRLEKTNGETSIVPKYPPEEDIEGRPRSSFARHEPTMADTCLKKSDPVPGEMAPVHQSDQIEEEGRHDFAAAQVVEINFEVDSEKIGEEVAEKPETQEVVSPKPPVWPDDYSLPKGIQHESIGDSTELPPEELQVVQLSRGIQASLEHTTQSIHAASEIRYPPEHELEDTFVSCSTSEKSSTVMETPEDEPAIDVVDASLLGRPVYTSSYEVVLKHGNNDISSSMMPPKCHIRIIKQHQGMPKAAGSGGNRNPKRFRTTLALILQNEVQRTYHTNGMGSEEDMSHKGDESFDASSQLVDLSKKKVSTWLHNSLPWLQSSGTTHEMMDQTDDDDQTTEQSVSQENLSDLHIAVKRDITLDSTKRQKMAASFDIRSLDDTSSTADQVNVFSTEIKGAHIPNELIFGIDESSQSDKSDGNTNSTTECTALKMSLTYQSGVKEGCNPVKEVDVEKYLWKVSLSNQSSEQDANETPLKHGSECLIVTPCLNDVSKPDEGGRAYTPKDQHFNIKAQNTSHAYSEEDDQYHGKYNYKEEG